MALLKSEWQTSSITSQTGQQHQTSLDASMHVAPEQYESLRDLLAVLRRFRWTIVFTAISVVALALLACLILTPKYSAIATLEIIPEATSMPGDVGASSSSSPATDDVKTEVTTDTNILQGNTLALATAEKLNLLSRLPYSRAVDKDEKGKSLDQAPLTRQKLLKVFGKALRSIRLRIRD